MPGPIMPVTRATQLGPIISNEGAAILSPFKVQQNEANILKSVFESLEADTVGLLIVLFAFYVLTLTLSTHNQFKFKYFVAFTWQLICQLLMQPKNFEAPNLKSKALMFSIVLGLALFYWIFSNNMCSDLVTFDTSDIINTYADLYHSNLTIKMMAGDFVTHFMKQMPNDSVYYAIYDRATKLTREEIQSITSMDMDYVESTAFVSATYFAKYMDAIECAFSQGSFANYISEEKFHPIALHTHVNDMIDKGLYSLIQTRYRKIVEAELYTPVLNLLYTQINLLLTDRLKMTGCIIENVDSYIRTLITEQDEQALKLVNVHNLLALSALSLIAALFILMAERQVPTLKRSRDKQVRHRIVTKHTNDATPIDV